MNAKNGTLVPISSTENISSIKVKIFIIFIFLFFNNSIASNGDRILIIAPVSFAA